MEVFRAASVLVIVVVGVIQGTPTPLENCSHCEKMVASISTMLSDRTRDQILPVLCEALSVDSTELCSELGELSPSKLCQQLGYCAPRGLGYESESDSGTELEIADSEGNSLPCVLCQNAMKIAHAFLSSKDHQKFLLNVLKSVCRFVPFLTKECVSFVDTYGNLAIKLAAHYLNPASCKLFHICPAGQAVFGDDCELCKFGVGVIYDTVQDPALETRIEQITQEICTEYVGDDEECESLAEELSQYLLSMAEELRHSDFFKNACERANICSDDEGSDDRESDDGLTFY